jgi:hypothetical protein
MSSGALVHALETTVTKIPAKSRLFMTAHGAPRVPHEFPGDFATTTINLFDRAINLLIQCQRTRMRRSRKLPPR